MNGLLYLVYLLATYYLLQRVSNKYKIFLNTVYIYIIMDTKIANTTQIPSHTKFTIGYVIQLYM